MSFGGVLVLILVGYLGMCLWAFAPWLARSLAGGTIRRETARRRDDFERRTGLERQPRRAMLAVHRPLFDDCGSIKGVEVEFRPVLIVEHRSADGEVLEYPIGQGWTVDALGDTLAQIEAL